MGSQNLIVFHLTIRTSSFLAQFYLDLKSKVVRVNVSSLKFSSDLNPICKWGHITLIEPLSSNFFLRQAGRLDIRSAGQPTPSKIVLSWSITALNCEEKLSILDSRLSKNLFTYLFIVKAFKQWSTYCNNPNGYRYRYR